MSFGDNRDLAVLGAHGFIGGATLVAARDLTGWTARSITRRGSGAEHTADIRDAGSLAMALAGASAIVHAAGYIGNDPVLCETVNVQGALNVASQARLQGAQLVYVSTASVYGRGSYELLREEDALIQPASTLSASRAEAERIVLDHGGIVVRPHLVVGHGDRWVGAGIAALTRSLGGLVDDGRARHSVIEVSQLGQLLTVLATAGTTTRNAYHAANLDPLTTRQLFEKLWPDSSPPPSVPALEAAQIAGTSARLTHALELLSGDHILDCRAAFTDTSIALDEPLALPRSAVSWYHALAH
ncbi:MAG: NAD-dependent epimerase/dehydratase family protein [Homoserinimonas sp.]